MGRPDYTTVFRITTYIPFMDVLGYHGKVLKAGKAFNYEIIDEDGVTDKVISKSDTPYRSLLKHSSTLEDAIQSIGTLMKYIVVPKNRPVSDFTIQFTMNDKVVYRERVNDFIDLISELQTHTLKSTSYKMMRFNNHIANEEANHA